MRIFLPLLLLSNMIAPVMAQGALNQGDDRDPGWKPLLSDRVKLPPYCLSQYDADFAQKTRTPTPVQMCGVYMNHFCPGLVLLNRAQEVNRPIAKRREYLRSALSQFEYTNRYMSPSCQIKRDVDAATMQANMLVQILR